MFMGKTWVLKTGSITSLAETPTCCDTCSGPEGDSAGEEVSMEMTDETADDGGETADDGSATVEAETPVP